MSNVNANFESERWDGSRCGVLFWARFEGDNVRCFASREFIHGVLGATGEGEQLLNAFREHREAFHSIVLETARANALVVVPGEAFEEAQMLADSSIPTRSAVVYRVNADQLIGSQIAKYAMDNTWWSQIANIAVADVDIAYMAEKFEFAELRFQASDAADAFVYRLGTFGVQASRV